MKNIIITGASGFVGSYLTRKLLEHGNNITIFVRKQSNLWRLEDILSQLDVRIVDMGDIDSLKININQIKPNLVYHLATYGAYPSQQDLTTVIQNNVLYSINLMSALENCSSLMRFINFGSSSEYGVKTKPMKESHITEPQIPYGIAKVAQSLFAQYFSKQRRVPIVTLRLFSVYGPYEEPGRLIHDIFMAIIKKQPLRLSSPTPRRDFIHLDDVINAIKNASEISSIDGEIFNVGSGNDYSIGEIVKLACMITKTNLEILWGSDEKKRIFDTDSTWVADIQKTKQLLHWKPNISLEEGLLKTYQWYTDNINVYKKIVGD